MMRIAVCIPVYNDWESALVLLTRLDDVATNLDAGLEILFVDDGSSDPVPTALDLRPHALRAVRVLRLRRNLGHQRAIAIALTQLYVCANHDAVLVMDGDGEDDPTAIPGMLARYRTHDPPRVVFAKRTKRSQTLLFRLGYLTFRLLHFVLVGRRVEVGNFSIVPRSTLERLVSVAELWNHYAAAVYHARLPVDMVPVARAPRIAGEGRMDTVSLVTHGLSAISVYSDIVGVRLLSFFAIMEGLVLAGLGALICAHVARDVAIPGWVATTAGLLMITLLDLVLLSLLLVLFTLRGRSQDGFLPLRDYGHFVLDERALFLPQEDEP